MIALITSVTQYINTAIWVIYLQDSHASLFQIGLSFTLFGLIIIFLSPAGGRFSDHHGRWVQLVVGLFLLGVTFCCYSLQLGTWWLVLCSGAEGVATVTFGSVLDGFLADATPDGIKGQV